MSPKSRSSDVWKKFCGFEFKLFLEICRCHSCVTACRQIAAFCSNLNGARDQLQRHRRSSSRIGKAESTLTRWWIKICSSWSRTRFCCPNDVLCCTAVLQQYSVSEPWKKYKYEILALVGICRAPEQWPGEKWWERVLTKRSDHGKCEIVTEPHIAEVETCKTNAFRRTHPQPLTPLQSIWRLAEGAD